MKIDTGMIAEKYKNSLFSAAFSICRNAADADDVVQDTLIQYHTAVKEFESEEHIRAWLLRVAINKAKNLSLSVFRKAGVPLEDYMDTLVFETPESRGLMEEVLKLPEKYRIVVHLFYYEEYSVREIAEILHTGESNVKVRLSRARKKLKEVLQEAWEDDDESGKI
ncbi:MAG: sigma-70 family RNA polymerase sigma factor [Oscillospiraceae bacterium]|nr:sigma-70 family RNA polymerase sigma factor [Oscillospiraceae bacterium]